MATKGQQPKLRVIEDCWNVYANHVMPRTAANSSARDFVRGAFYAGVAFMFDVMMNNCDDETAGVAALDSVAAELDEHAEALAAQAGMKASDVREAIRKELSRHRGGQA